MHRLAHDAPGSPRHPRWRRTLAGLSFGLWPLVLWLAAPAPPHATAQAALVASDDFSDPSSGWLIEDKPQRSFDYTAGAYHGRIKVPNYGAYGYWNRNLTDFDARIDVQRSSADGKNGVVYLAFRVTASARFYAFMINDVDKWCRLVVYDNSQTYTDFDCQDHIKTAPEWNALRVVTKGHDLTFYVNNAQVGSVTDSTFSSGNLGLGLAALDGAGGYEANYDNFKLYLENGVPIPVTLTPFRFPTAPSRRTATPRITERTPTSTATRRVAERTPTPTSTATATATLRIPEHTPTSVPTATAEEPTSTPLPPPSPTAVPTAEAEPTSARLYLPQLEKR